MGGPIGRVLALAALVTVAFAPAAEAAGPRAIDKSQRDVLRAGTLRVQVVAPRAGRVRVSARRGHVVLARRTVSFTRPGRRTVRLALTPRGRAAVESCRPGTIVVAGPGGRTRSMLRVDASACRPDTPAPLRAGAASADITPPIGTPLFAYTARSGVASPDKAPELALQVIADPDKNLYAKSFVASRGIHTRVRARAIVLQTARGKFALVQADLGGLPYALTQEVQKRIAATGIEPDRLLLSATHTHSSSGAIWPSDSTGYAALGGDAFDPRVFDLTAQGIAEAILAADDRLEPARAATAQVAVTDASANRNFEPFRRNPDVPQDEEGARAASIDPGLTLLRVDSRDGQPLGVWSNFAIHPTSFGDGNLLFSGDNAAFAERIAERRITEAAPVPPRSDRPVVDVWSNANQGDISPRAAPRKVDGEATEYAAGPYAGAHLPGLRVADGIFRAWQEAGRNLKPSLELDSRRAFVDFDGTQADGEPVGPLPVLGPGGIVAPDGFCAPVDGLAGPGQGMKAPGLSGRGIVPSTVPVSIFRIGSLGVAGLPGEVTKQMGHRIRTAITRESGGVFDSTLIAGLSNGYISYTATPEEYDACHYEGSFTLYGRRQGARYRDFATGLTRSLVAGEPAPAGAPEPIAAGVGPGQVAQPRVTPDAGEVIDQPRGEIARRERVTFHWKGGDTAYDAPRGGTFVAVEHREADGSWRQIASDDGFQDITERTREDGSITETFQFADCDPLGTYRFRVRGRADRGNGPEPYETVSRTFELSPATLEATAPAVAGTLATVRALYPDPGPETLMALPRLVGDGRMVVETTPPGGRPKRMSVRAGSEDLAFRFRVAPGTAVRVLSVSDGCGNRGS